MKKVDTLKAPRPIGPYSQALLHKGILYVSMQLPLDPRTGKMVSRDLTDQMVQVCENIKAILDEAECSLSEVLKVTLYVEDPKDLPTLNEIYSDYFADKPARSIVHVASLPEVARVALDVIATQNII